MSIEVFNESGRGEVNEEELIDIARYALWTMDVHSAAELSIHLVDEETMADLHVRWMNLSGPTDVLSFPMDELTPGWGRKDGPPSSPAMLGDIMLCPDFAEGQADRAGHSLAHELDLLTVHGVLHLLGFDHVTPEEEQEMFSLQNEILANWYDSHHERGVSFAPKPTGAAAFPTAAQRDDTGQSPHHEADKASAEHVSEPTRTHGNISPLRKDGPDAPGGV